MILLVEKVKHKSLSGVFFCDMMLPMVILMFVRKEVVPWNLIAPNTFPRLSFR